MTSIIFCTKEPIDRSAFTMFGVSAKTTSNPIGKYGTGLKYAIAVCARLGVEFILYTRDYQDAWFAERLSTHPLTVRDQEFVGIKLGEHTLPFSTNLGCNWKLWQAVRELKANTEDEGGELMFKVEGEDQSIDFAYLRDQYQTVIVIRDATLSEITNSWQHYFPEIEPLHTANNIEIFENLYDAPTGIYNHGYLIYTPDKPLRYSYNFLGEVDLTEDRTAANQEKLLNQAKSALLVNQWELDEDIFLEYKYAEYDERYLECYFGVWDSTLFGMKAQLSDSLKTKLMDYLKTIETHTIRELNPTPKLQALLDAAIAVVKPIWPDIPVDQFVIATVTTNHSWDDKLYINLHDSLPENVFQLLSLYEEPISKTTLLKSFTEALCQLHAAAETVKQGEVFRDNRQNIFVPPDADNVVVEHGELTYTELRSSVSRELVPAMVTGSPTDEGLDTVLAGVQEKYETIDPEDEHEFYSEGSADRDPVTPSRSDPDSYIPDERNKPEPDYSFKE